MKNKPTAISIRAGRCGAILSWILIAMFGLVGQVAADPNTSFPFRDNFEQYTNGTPLVDGTTNGWYGSTNDDVAGATNMILVQNEVAYLSAQSVAVPVEHTLSNRFKPDPAVTSVWIQADVRVVLTDDDLDDGAEIPRTLTVDNTNASALFYINTSGYFVVHNGPASPSITNSTNWVVLSSATPCAESDWVRVKMHMDYQNQTWSLWANHAELTNNIQFLNPDSTQFSGFDLYNGVVANTTFMDNVYISLSNDSPDLYVDPTSVSRVILQGTVPDGTNITFVNAGPGTYNYTVTISNDWLSSTTNTGILDDSTGRTNLIPLTFNPDIANWGKGTSNMTVVLESPDNGGVVVSFDVSVQVVDWAILEEDGSSVFNRTMTNKVMRGNTPAAQIFSVSNFATASENLICAVESTMGWLTPAPTSFTNAPGVNRLLTNNFASTASWTPGASQATVNVSSLGVTQSVDVVLNVMQMTNDAAGLIRTYVMEGGFLPQPYTFGIVNQGPGEFSYVVTSSVPKWVYTNSSAVGSVGDYGTNTVTVEFTKAYTNTLGKTNVAMLTVASADGGGATNQIRLELVVNARPEGSNLSFYAATNGLHLEPFTNWSMAATNIQDVLAIVQDGNNVFLSNGTFNLTNTVTITNALNFQGWDDDPGSTILEGDGTTNCMVINNTGACVSAMTIMNGQGGPAGGVYMPDGGTLSNCSIMGNTSEVGGVFAGTNAQLISCVISGNVGNVVGGIDLQGATLLDSLIVGNVSTGAAGYGGGVSMGYQSNNLVSNCMITANSATNIGGGVAMINGEIVSCTVALNNQLDPDGGGGGGIVVMGTNAEQEVMIRLTTIESNTAAANGGGVLFTNAPEYSRTLRNCLVSENSPDGVYQAEAVTNEALDTIESCTIVNNTGEGLHLLADQTNLFVLNNIVYLNGTDINASLGDTLNGMSNNCAFYTEFPPAQGNLTNDPLFIASGMSDYRLSSISLCLLAGTNQDWMTNAVDLNGVDRLIELSVDIGAYAGNNGNWIIVYGDSTNEFALTNQVMLGRTPSEQTFSLINRGSTPLDYVITNSDWLFNSYINGHAEPYSTNEIRVIYSPTTDWTPDTSNTVLNVMVTNPSPTQTRPVPVVLKVMDLQASVTSLTSSVMDGHMPANVSIVVSNAGVGEFDFVVTNAAWMSASSTNGALGPHSQQTIDITYPVSIASWGPGFSNTTIEVISTNGGGVTQSVVVTVNIMHLDVTPLVLSNSVMLGGTPIAKSITVQNTGGGTFDYSIVGSAGWVTATPANGRIPAFWGEPVQIDYGSTADWLPGVSNATLKIVSADGGGSTQTVAIVLNVVEMLPPTEVAASKGAYADTVRVTWKLAANAKSYLIWRNTINDAVTAELQGSAINAVYDDISAVQGAVYYYWLKSVNDLGVSVFSAADYGARKLAVPTGVSASKRTYTDKVRVTWNGTVNATGYQVWRNTASSSGTAIKIGQTTATTYDDNTAVKEVTYYYWVKSMNIASISDFGASDIGIRKEDTPVPNAPSGLTASQGTYSDKVALTWAASAYAAKYEVWRNTVSDSSSAAKIAEPTAASYNDTSAVAGTLYYFWVKAKNVSGTSRFSGVASGYRLDLSLTPMFGDYDGDRLSDPAVYQAATGRWFVKLSGSGYATATLSGFGGAGYTAFVADYDGDGKVDLGIFERATGNWKVKLSGSGYSTVPLNNFGNADSAVVAVDFDGDGLADPAIYNTVNGNWRIMLSGSGYGIATVVGFGGAGFTQVTANYDADNRADPGIYGKNNGNWTVMLSAQGYGTAALPAFGGVGSVPLMRDFDGDGLADLGFYKESTRSWYIKLSGSDYSTAVLQNFGGAGYMVGADDFDGDRKADPSLFQNSTRMWSIKPSASGYPTVTIDCGYTP